MSDDLIKRIKEGCAGRDRWYVMNAAEDGYCMDFDWQLTADQWMAERLRENPDYIKRNGYHIVKQRSFTAAEGLANEGADLIEQQAARIAELEHEAGFTKPVDAADSTYPNSLGVAQTLRRCKEDLHTEARFVLWQAKRIAELEAQIATVAPAVDAQPVGEIAHNEIDGFHFAPSVHWLKIGIGTKLYATPHSEGLRKALTEIAEQEHVELMLDPTWAQRIAIDALSQHTGEKDD